MTGPSALHIDAWDPSYGRAYSAGEESPANRSSAPVDVSVERPAGSWLPLTPGPEVRAPQLVLLVDGVRRIDARVWATDATGTHPGIAASYAAGAVCCDLGKGVAELVGTPRIERGMFISQANAVPLVAHEAAVYQPHRVNHPDPAKLEDALQDQLGDLEIEVSRAARQAADGDELLVLDGPLRERIGLARALGYAKTHRTTYLDGQPATVVGALQAGQRTPLFGLGGRWNRYSWYLRLPGPAGSPWAGVVRVECSATLTVGQAIELADVSAVTLPRFASTPYKDPRAPQNLTPIAGLERRLRAQLGDPRLLHRGLRVAAASTATVTA